MYNRLPKREETRLRRKMRIKGQLRVGKRSVRLAVSKTNKHLYAQLIDDVKGTTLFGLGTMSQEFRGKDLAKKSKSSAKEIGMRVALFAKSNQVEEIIFDRGRYKFHGLIAELAQGAREGGLRF